MQFNDYECSLHQNNARDACGASEGEIGGVLMRAGSGDAVQWP